MSISILLGGRVLGKIPCVRIRSRESRCQENCCFTLIYHKIFRLGISSQTSSEKRVKKLFSRFERGQCATQNKSFWLNLPPNDLNLHAPVKMAYPTRHFWRLLQHEKYLEILCLITALISNMNLSLWIFFKRFLYNLFATISESVYKDFPIFLCLSTI